MIFPEKRLLTDDSHKIAYLIFFSKTRKDVAKCVVCCSCDWRFKGYLKFCLLQVNLTGCNPLTHLFRMYFPILIDWTSQFPILWLLGGIFHFYSNFKRKFCKQTVENLIRRRVLRRLIWFCCVCRCPTKRTLWL